MGSLTDKTRESREDWRRSRVSFGIRRHEYGRQIAIGERVDLNACIAQGVRVRDVVKLEWFDPIEPARE